MKKMMKALVLVIALCLVLTGCQYLPEIPGLNQNPEHVHTLIHNAEKAPTCVNNGILEHWYCPGCNARFSDEAATTEVTFADLEVEETGHVAGADDGDCTTAVDCTVCGKVATPAAKAHTPEEDDGDCTTNVMCTQCAKIAIPAKAAHEQAEDDGDCTTAVTCAHCDHVFVPAAEAHTPGDEATCTTAQTCTVCGTEITAATGHTAGDAATCTTAQTCTVCETVLVEALGHSGHEEDFNCDVCGAAVLPADGTALTIPQALAIAKIGGSAYTTQKYYITGIVTGLYNTTYGNFYIKDAEGNQICIYGLYSADGKTRYDAMNYKPVNGDEVTVYTVLGMYNTTAQGKNAWLDEVVAHEHSYTSTVTAPTCTMDGYTTHSCSICGSSSVDTEVPALGHTTDNGTCERCGNTIGGAPVFGTLAEFTFGTNSSAAHVDGNDYGTSKSFTANGYTLALSSMSKVYGPAYDAKGNSCIKLGTSSTTGSFKFTVPEDVTEVVIYVAKYKANTTKITVNGTAYTINGASNNGVYDAITIDTTTTKTITFSTVSGGVRCMINTIEFKGYSN